MPEIGAPGIWWGMDLRQRPPVDRGPLFASPRIRIHDNRCCRSDRAVSAETAPLEFHEIVFPRRGAWVRHRGRERIVVDANRLHFFARGESHRVSHPGGCGDRNTGLVLSNDALAALDPRAHDRGAFPALFAGLDGAVYVEHGRLVDGLERGAIGALEAEERALALARVALATANTAAGRRRHEPLAPGRRRRELAIAAQELLGTALARPLELADVAEALDVSVFHLCRVFRAEVGTTMHAYRRSLRVRAALPLLADRRLTLYDVAERTGFADRTQLHRAVRAELGQAPRDLREAFAREQDPPRARHTGP